MMPNNLFKLDLSETFPQLANPPIVEAVIHWQARAQVHFELSELESAIAAEFPGYSSRKPLHQFGMMAQMSTESEDSEENFVKKTKRWEGIRLKSDDDKYVIQFTRNGLVFSQTKGYENWELFSAAAKEAWGTFVKISRPAEVERLGVRYINHFSVATPANIGDFLREPPTNAQNLQLKEFVYQSTFGLPGSPFDVRVIKVMQQSSELKESGLFIDIDVFTKTPSSIVEAELDESLQHIRWLKNKVFFGLITENAVELLGGKK